MRVIAAGTALLGALLTLAGPAVADEVRPPRAISTPAAQWPEGEAHAHDLQVIVALVVAADGRVAEVEVLEGLGEPFDSAAVGTAKTWSFEPARDARGPVRARIRAVVRFAARAQAPEPKLEVEAHEHAGEEHHHHGEEAPHEHDEHDGADHSEHGHRAKPAPSSPVTIRGQARARSASAVTRQRDILDAAPHRTASDMLLTVPGVFVTQHSGEGKAHQIFFRGFDAVHGQDIEIWAGGAPVNEVSNVHGQGYADLHFLMPEVIQQLTALPGPYAPQQGDFAVAGSMLFDLGYEEPGATVKGTVGSYGARRVFLAYRPRDMTEESFAAAEAYTSDGFGQGRAADRASAIAQWRFPLGESVSMRLLASTYAGRFGSAGVLRLDDVESGSIGRFSSYDTDQGGSSARHQVVAALERQTESARLHLTPYLVRRSLQLRSNFTGFLDDPTNGDRTHQRNDSTTVGATGAYRRRLQLISERDELELGFSARNDWIEQSDKRLAFFDNSVTDTRVDSEVRATTIGGWVDAALFPIRRVALRGGARFDGISFAVDDADEGPGSSRSSQGTHIGFKGTLDVGVVPGLNALGSYGQGFRSPQARSLGAGEKTPFTDVESMEVGLRYRDRKRLAVSLAAFRTVLTDDVVFNEATARNEAVPGTLRLGVAVDFEARPAPWFTSALGFTYTRATFQESQGNFEQDTLVPFVPQVVMRSDQALRGELTELWEHALEGQVGLGLSYLYRRPIPYGEIGSNVFLADAKSKLRLKMDQGRAAEVGLDVLNLFDTEWNDGEFVYASNFNPSAPGSRLPVRHITAGPPRMLFLSLTLIV